MTRPTWRGPGPISVGLLAAALALGGGGCEAEAPAPGTVNRIPVDGIGLTLPVPEGWSRDPDVGLEDPAKGGTVLRILRTKAVIGSPRIDVVIEPAGPEPTGLQSFVDRQLRMMAGLESDGRVRMTNVSQRPVKVGPRPAYRVRHEYLMTGEPGTDPMAFTQLTTFLVLDGRGITVSALGRTELFHPQAAAIGSVLDGLATPVPAGVTVVEELDPAGPSPVASPPEIKPIDLGTVGGK